MFKLLLPPSLQAQEQLALHSQVLGVQEHDRHSINLELSQEVLPDVLCQSTQVELSHSERVGSGDETSLTVQKFRNETHCTCAY